MQGAAKKNSKRKTRIKNSWKQILEAYEAPVSNAEQKRDSICEW